LNKQIAYDLDLTLATIKFHRARGLIKLGVNSVPELVLLLDKLGVLDTPIGPVSQR
jgi:FixJ family two-component response regulator